MARLGESRRGSERHGVVMIDILVPVLNRPANAQPLVDSIRANTTLPHQIVFLTSPGDTAEYDACRATGQNVLIVDNPGLHGDYAVKINAGFRVTSNPYVLCAADDLEFTPEWDTIAVAVAEQSGGGMVGTNDMANRHVMNGGFSTHPMFTRVYLTEQGGSLDGPGVVYHEGYDHNYVDREAACVAQHRGEWAFAIESKVIHRHPGWRNPRADSTYKKGARLFHQDHALFIERSAGWDRVGLVAEELRYLERQEQPTGRRR